MTEPLSKLPRRQDDAIGVPAPGGVLTGLVLVACADSNVKTIGSVLKSVDYRLSTDPVLSDSLRVVGPHGLTRASRWKLLNRGTDGKRVRTALDASLSESVLEPSARVAVGIVVIEDDPQALITSISELRGSTDLAVLPIHLRGISLAHAEGELPADIVSVDPAHGPIRLDSLIVEAGINILETAQVSDEMSIPARVLAEITSAQVAPENTSDIAAARIIDDEEAASHAALVAATHQATPTHVPVDRPRTQLHDAYTVQEDLPLRLTYLVVALSAESRPRPARSRIYELVIALDRGLTPAPETFASRSWLVAAGRADEHKPIMKATGTISRADIWRPNMDFLDMTRTMTELLSLISENISSYERRSHPLTKPLVLFVMPTATMSGERCLSLYRKLKEVTDIGWLITDKCAQAPHPEVDLTRVAIDKDDVVNELLYAVGYPQYDTVNNLTTDHGEAL